MSGMMQSEVLESVSLETARQAIRMRYGDSNLTDLRLSEVLLLHGLVGESPSIGRLRTTLKKVASIDAPALIVGPTGSGKELAARAIHALSPRRDQPLVTINCGALTESLVEAQLFGHEKGYFTGADRARDGYLTEADRGTLFLDEIAELPLSLQTKLLRVLDNRTFRVLGASQDIRFEGRIIAATHVDLQSRVREGRFRQDLYYRLEVFTVSVPALDERKEDVPLLVEHFLRKTGRRLRFAPEALAALEQLDWPGNVRQLRNLVQRLATFAEREVVTAADVELHRAANICQADAHPNVPQQSACTSGEALVRGLSIRQQRRRNALQLAQNQIRLLELEGCNPDVICSIMGIGRATFFRIKAGQA